MKINRGGDILNELLKRYIGKNIVIPYEAEDRFKLYPLAFKELEGYMSEEYLSYNGFYVNKNKLLTLLKNKRKELAAKLNITPFVIFQDLSLEVMSTTYPITLEELQNIQGVGSGKAKRYGKEFIELIKKYCEENKIERSENLRVHKSKLEASIIQYIDRKIALDDIAEAKGLEFSDLLDEIEAIVYSGTKINIDYFINEIMDEDIIDDILDYFKESQTDNINEAVNELGSDYSKEEIRLIGIKFISEMGN